MRAAVCQDASRGTPTDHDDGETQTSRPRLRTKLGNSYGTPVQAKRGCPAILALPERRCTAPNPPFHFDHRRVPGQRAWC